MAQGLNSRQKYILHLLSERVDVGIDELVRRLEVSRRTIQRDLTALQRYLSPFDVELETGADVVRLSGLDTEIRRAIDATGKLPSTLAFTSKNRALYVALELLLSHGPLKLSYLGKKFHVTSASISHDLDQVSDWLRSRKMTLIRRQGYGIEVAGDEVSRLEAMAELIHQQLSMNEFMSILRGQADEVDVHPFDVWLTEWFGFERLEEVRAVLSEELASMVPPLDEAAFYGFMLHVLLTCSRIESGVQMDHVDGQQGLSAEIALCTRILQQLVPDAKQVEAEAMYLAKHLRGAKVQMTEDSRILPLNITTMDLAYHLARNLSETLQVPLAEDRELLLGLAQHLEPAIYRMKHGLTIRNPLLDEVKRRYPFLFDAMRAASQQVIELHGLNVPDAEIGYLTMHLGAALERWKSGNVWRVKIVCPNGISSAELLASRIRNEFPQVQVVSINAIDTINDQDCDFIVSTVPIQARMRPTITVSPFLHEEDVLRVQNVIQDLERTFTPMKQRYAQLERDPVDLTTQLAEELSRRVQVYRAGPDDVTELIKWVSETAVLTGDATDVKAVVSAIEERERLGSIVLPGKAFAVLHARTSVLNRCHVAVYRLHSPIAMQSVGETHEAVDSALVLLARKEEEPAVVHLLGRLSSALVMDPSIVETLRTAPVEEVRRSVLDAMNQTEE
ncbi:BglG family transcription antiterminator [Alicyclobacillus pomorum]|uniref:BglG family transcription antiterminator n=1 Tax=Alicyclobacillus pomorum TaxID=204470 RepID=UPI000415244F|nr:BglG family transcription antiterminator [Alicyclobacillus pomorum]